MHGWVPLSLTLRTPVSFSLPAGTSFCHDANFPCSNGLTCVDTPTTGECICGNPSCVGVQPAPDVHSPPPSSCSHPGPFSAQWEQYGWGEHLGGGGGRAPSAPFPMPKGTFFRQLCFVLFSGNHALQAQLPEVIFKKVQDMEKRSCSCWPCCLPTSFWQTMPVSKGGETKQGALK